MAIGNTIGKTINRQAGVFLASTFDRKLCSKTPYRKSGHTPLIAKKIMIVTGTTAVAARKMAAQRMRFDHDCPNLSRPTSSRAISAPAKIDNNKSTDFIEIPKHKPRRRPATKARRVFSGPSISATTHNNQRGAHKLSVRNSNEAKW